MNKDELINELTRQGYLKTPLLIEAFREIDRKDFVLRESWDEAYGNYPLPIGFGQTISQPLTVAFMLELLSPKSGEKILDVGSGSGWQTALLAYVVSKPRTDADSTQKDAEIFQRKSASSQRRSAGYVVAVERIPELKEMTEENVDKYGFIKKGIVEIVLGDGSRGAPPTLRPVEGFDKIIAAATAEKIPEAWKKQLKIGGRIVAPVGQSIVVLDKISEREFREKEHFGFSFVPLVRD